MAEMIKDLMGKSADKDEDKAADEGSLHLKNKLSAKSATTTKRESQLTCHTQQKVTPARPKHGSTPLSMNISYKKFSSKNRFYPQSRKRNLRCRSKNTKIIITLLSQD